MNIEAIKTFEELGYLKLEEFISEEWASILYNHVKISATRAKYLETNYPNTYNPAWHGLFNDTQAPGDYSRYGDPIFDTLLLMGTNKIEAFTGKKLTPTYTYHRLYTTNSELVRHIDRPSCEISTTLYLGSDTTNMPDYYDWPMFVGPKTGEKGTQGKAVHLKPGDLIIYRGCECEHWREPFKGKDHAQVFMHYNESGGQYDIKFDGRPILGIPRDW